MEKVNHLNNWEQTGQRLGGIRRSKVFELWYSGALGSVLVGAKRFSTDRQIDEYIAKLESAA
ncbi:hypothetical protein MSTE_00988 [Mycobacteroides stephanolepidis]|uniref:Uncharacterized protein n=1 Tax=[Mycobacterium] stephanolepidis TaxID=1520670 RepID=A0A1Z4ETR5_9MYCO|nr:hypothetical protein [[Mycobacterium] stephanolepidis]BAX96323.1 hypothetical protein MSTE_00988 [[Mycobacterium] stephanolepidis]